MNGTLIEEGPIKRNTVVDIMSKKDVDGELWYRVKYEGKVGYVLGKLIETN